MNIVAHLLRPHRLAALLLLTATLLTAQPAEAGRRPFIWVWDTEVLHEREIEVEQWIWEVQTPERKVAWLWWSPIIGITDTLELAIPIEAAWWRAPSPTDPGKAVADTNLETWGLSLRWRLAENDPDESGPLVPLVRLAVKRLLTQVQDGSQLWQIEGNVVLSYDISKLHSTLDLGFFYNTGDAQWASYAFGTAWSLNDAIRIGGEVFGEVGLSTGRKSFTMVGPDIGWTHGRAWLTVGMLVGVSESAADWMPRLIWAIKL